MSAQSELRGKVAIVTGGGQGIGKAISLALVQAGARVVLAYNTSEQGASQVVGCARENQTEALAVHADMQDVAELHALVDTAVDAFGVIDILVNNAGVAIYQPLLEMPLEVWNSCLQINLTSAFVLAQRVARVMVQMGTKGRIVNISSVGGALAQEGLAHYNASKGGLNQLTKAMALELGPHGIRVNAIAAGAVEVDRNRASLVEGTYPELWRRTIPIGRWGQPEEIAAIALFLCSEESAFISGHILNADGGQTVQVPQPPYDFAKWERR